MLRNGRPAVALLFAAVCLAGAAPPAALRSASGRFLVRGGPAEDRAGVASWADDLAARMERALGVTLVFGRGETVEILLEEPPAPAPADALSRSQVRTEGRGRLLVLGPRTVDQEDMLEALCGLLLYRLPGNPVPEDVRFPDWATVGLAQSLYAPLRGRAAARAARMGPDDMDRFPVERLLRLLRLPPGRGEEKELCGLLFGWMQGRGRLNLLFARLSAGRPATPEWLASFLGYSSLADMEQDWDLWLVARRQMLGGHHLPPSGQSAWHLLEEVRPEILSLASGRPYRSGLSPEALIEQHDEPWMEALGAAMLWQIQSLAIGRPPDICDGLEAYAAFFRELGRPRGGRRRKELLLRLLRAARAAAERAGE